MINRKEGPIIQNSFDLSIKNVSELDLSNGLKIIELNSGTQEIIKLELVLKAGRVNEKKVAAAKAAIRLLREGSSDYTASDLANKFDFYGASVRLSTGMEYSSVSLVCMTRFFNDIFPIWLNMLLSPIYDLSEVEKYIQIESQKLTNQLSKNDVTSYRVFTEKLFTSEHPYGYNTEPEDILNLKKQDIQKYYDEEINFERGFVFLSGHYPESIRQKIIKSFEAISKPSSQGEVKYFDPQQAIGLLNINTDNELQASIKIGKLLFNRKHEDYNAFSFMNTILGGYFGSRLMKNIREEKGYTYGIYSLVESWNHGGFFYISADVGKDLTEPTQVEIMKEINILKNELVDEEELSMVKNYLMGQSLNLIDGPFATSQLIKSLYTKNLDIEDFHNHIKSIKDMNAKKVQKMAEKYLNENSLLTVLVGGYNA